MLNNHEVQKSCTNCLYEYFCNWKPAGDRPCCEDWKSEVREKEGAGEWDS